MSPWPSRTEFQSCAVNVRYWECKSATAMPGRQHSTTCHPFLPLLYSLWSFFCSVRWALAGWFGAEHLTIAYSQHFEYLWVSAVTAAHSKKKPLCGKLTTALVCGHKQNEYLACLCSRTAAVAWVLRLTTFQIKGLWPALQYQSCEGFRSYRDVAGYSGNTPATVSPVGASCLVGW